MQKLFRNVPILDTGARAATTTFVQRGIGDILLTWENEAFLALNQLGKDQFQIVMPTISILAEPPVAVVDKNAEKKGTLQVAQAYLNFLYTPKAQELAVKHYYRPLKNLAKGKTPLPFLKTNLVTIDQLGGWQKLQEEHFNDGGLFDKIFKK